MMALATPPSLTSIAFSCGFGSSSDFTRSFKQRFGVPPSAFDIRTWRRTHAEVLEEGVKASPFVAKLPVRSNPDSFRVRIRELPAQTVAYVRVSRPYEGDRVIKAVQRLVAWAESHGLADGQWLGYQWENPEITALKDCAYYIAVVAERFRTGGEIGRYSFPPMRVAQVEIRGGIELELRALQWFYGSWLPRSGYVPDDLPAFEAFIGRPFAHGTTHFELYAQVPIRRGVGARDDRSGHRNAPPRARRRWTAHAGGLDSFSRWSRAMGAATPPERPVAHPSSASRAPARPCPAASPAGPTGPSWPPLSS